MEGVRGTSTEGAPRVGSAALCVTALGQVLTLGRRAQAVEARTALFPMVTVQVQMVYRS